MIREFRGRFSKFEFKNEEEFNIYSGDELDNVKSEILAETQHCKLLHFNYSLNVITF